MTKKAPYMPLYGKDAWSDERFAALPWDVQGLFWRLAYWQWVEGSIPADVETVAAIIGKPRETKRMWPKIVDFFQVVPSDPTRRANGRLEEHRADAVARTGQHKDGADKTNNKRWGSLSDSQCDSPSDKRATPFFIASRVANENAMSYAQFMFIATQVAKWRGENEHLYDGEDEGFRRAFGKRFSMTWVAFQALRDGFAAPKESA